MAKILIVEDDIALNQAYELILKKEGHEVQTAFDGQEALDKAEKFKPLVILLDLLMPVKGGLDFLREYDVLKKHKDTFVVILSNLGDEAAVEEGMELGAYKYVVKAHASPAQLSVLVNHLINKNIEKKEEVEEPEPGI
jgi:two-component system alkaline phosphatase synthesis response regulator PhoP